MPPGSKRRAAHELLIFPQVQLGVTDVCVDDQLVRINVHRATVLLDGILRGLKDVFWRERTLEEPATLFQPRDIRTRNQVVVRQAAGNVRGEVGSAVNIDHVPGPVRRASIATTVANSAESTGFVR